MAIFGGFGQAVARPSAQCKPTKSAECWRCPRARQKLRRLVFAAEIHDRMTRQKFDEMFGNADRPHARAAAAVRNAERFVQIQMANIRADIAGAAKADLRIHVRAVHVNLAAVCMNDFANLSDAFLENAVRGGIGDHQTRRDRFLFASALARRSLTSMLPLRIASDGDDFHPGHDGAGGIGAVSGSRDQANIAMRFATALVIFADHEQAGVFALRTGVGLQRNCRRSR